MVVGGGTGLGWRTVPGRVTVEEVLRKTLRRVHFRNDSGDSKIHEIDMKRIL